MDQEISVPKIPALIMGLILIAIFFLSGCGGSGGGGSSAPSHVVDSTPHDYLATAYALTNTALPHPFTLHQVCNFGLAGVRDETSNVVLSDANGTSSGIGCNAAANYTFEGANTGTDVVYLVISIDGALQPQEIIQPGTTYTFQRGF